MSEFNLQKCIAGELVETVVHNLYRYDSYRYEVFLHEYKIIKETLHGTWIDVYGKEKFVLREARKHFACYTKEDAMESFKARKNRQIRILSAQLESAKNSLEKAINGDTFSNLMNFS